MDDSECRMQHGSIHNSCTLSTNPAPWSCMLNFRTSQIPLSSPSLIKSLKWSILVFKPTSYCQCRHWQFEVSDNSRPNITAAYKGTGLSALFTLRCHFNSILPPICWSSPWSFSVVGHDILGQGVSFLATCKGAMAACQALVDEEMECIPKTQKMMSLWQNIGCTSKLAMGWQCFWFHWGWTGDEASALTT